MVTSSGDRRWATTAGRRLPFERAPGATRSHWSASLAHLAAPLKDGECGCVCGGYVSCKLSFFRSKRHESARSLLVHCKWHGEVQARSHRNPGLTPLNSSRQRREVASRSAEGGGALKTESGDAELVMSSSGEE